MYAWQRCRAETVGICLVVKYHERSTTVNRDFTSSSVSNSRAVSSFKYLEKKLVYSLGENKQKDNPDCLHKETLIMFIADCSTF